MGGGMTRPVFIPTALARHDPVSDIIGLSALISGLTGGALAVGGAATAVGGALIGIGASLTVSYAASLLSKPTGSAPIASDSTSALINSPQIVQVTERQALPSKRIIYGTALTGGALFFEDVKPPYLYQGILIAAHKVSAFRQVSISTEQLGFTVLAPNQILTPIAINGQPNYPGRLKLSLRLGDDDQVVDALLAQDYANLGDTFRQQGIATAVLRYDYGADFDEYTALWGQTSRPSPLFLVDGIAVPDPRNPTHILDWDPSDPESVAQAEASWSFSNNASLVQAHYLTQRFGGRIRPDRINWDKVARGADWDDGLIYCLDGTSIKRHTIDGVITLNQTCSDVLSSMISANRGFVLESAGRMWPSSSAPRSTIATIHDGWLTGAVSYQAAKPKKDLINRVKVQFIAPDQEYQEVDGPVLTRNDLVEADGELLETTLSLPFTLDDRRAQRLEKAYLENARLGKQVSCTVDVAWLADCQDDPVGSAVIFDSVLFAKANGTYLCTQWGFSDNSFSSIDLSLTEYDPTIETDYVAATDEQPFTITPPDLS